MVFDILSPVKIKKFFCCLARTVSALWENLLYLWTWWKYMPPKFWYLSTKLHGVKIVKTVILQ